MSWLFLDVYGMDPCFDWIRLNTSFSLKLLNVANKLECLTLRSISNVVQCNTLAYWAHLRAANKMKSC
jgi:hypothetical protein